MKRRLFLQGTLTAALSAGIRPSLWAAIAQAELDGAAMILQSAVDSRQVESATLGVVHRGKEFHRWFGKAESTDAMFLLGSISKPICVTALMTLFDEGEFQLDDPLKKYLPKFTGAGRERITIRQLLSHVSGLPDQLPENNMLRSRHAELSEFVEHAIRTPLLFTPGERYQYASMGILLATHVAEVITGTDIREFVDTRVFQPLQMTRSAQGLGRFDLSELIRCQTEHAAPESGAGDPGAKNWDWNSPYWRSLGAPWGATHASAPDLVRFLSEFLNEQGTILKPETARQMVTNQNRLGLAPRGLGFHVGSSAGSPGCSERTFGHTGSTGTIAWADPKSETICIILTSLPGRASNPHPRELVSRKVAASIT